MLLGGGNPGRSQAYNTRKLAAPCVSKHCTSSEGTAYNVCGPDRQGGEGGKRRERRNEFRMPSRERHHRERCHLARLVGQDVRAPRRIGGKLRAIGASKGLTTTPVGKANVIKVTSVATDQPGSDQAGTKGLPEGSRSSLKLNGAVATERAQFPRPHSPRTTLTTNRDVLWTLAIRGVGL